MRERVGDPYSQHAETEYLAATYSMSQKKFPFCCNETERTFRSVLTCPPFRSYSSAVPFLLVRRSVLTRPPFRSYMSAVTHSVLTCPRSAVPSVPSFHLNMHGAEGTSGEEDALLRLPKNESAVFSLAWCFTMSGSEEVERGGAACESSGSDEVLQTLRRDRLNSEASGQWEAFKADPRCDADRGGTDAAR